MECRCSTHLKAAGNSNADIDNPTVDNGSPNDVPEEQIIKNRNVKGGFDIPTMLDKTISVSSTGMNMKVEMNPVRHLVLG